MRVERHEADVKLTSNTYKYFWEGKKERDKEYTAEKDKTPF
jgi:hypothetical protein